MNFITFQSLLLTIFLIKLTIGGPEEEHGVKYADPCEVCKVVVTELENRLLETGKTHDVLELGYSIDEEKKTKKEYAKSDLRLVETLENLCETILNYNIHKERKDSTRFSKGRSQTFQTLHGLVDKGVKVELGIPYDLWDKPSVEITTLKSSCETFLEMYEGDIEDWYYREQGKIPLSRYLCTNIALKGKDDSCLREKGDTGKIEDKKIKQKIKKSSGKTEDSKKPEDLKEEL